MCLICMVSGFFTVLPFCPVADFAPRLVCPLAHSPLACLPWFICPHTLDNWPPGSSVTTELKMSLWNLCGSYVFCLLSDKYFQLVFPQRKQNIPVENINYQGCGESSNVREAGQARGRMSQEPNRPWGESATVETSQGVNQPGGETAKWQKSRYFYAYGVFIVFRFLCTC